MTNKHCGCSLHALSTSQKTLFVKWFFPCSCISFLPRVPGWRRVVLMLVVTGMQKKRGNRACRSSRRLEALACPSKLNEQRWNPRMLSSPGTLHQEGWGDITTLCGHPPLRCPINFDCETARFLSRLWNKARSKRLFLCRRKVKKYFSFVQIFFDLP